MPNIESYLKRFSRYRVDKVFPLVKSKKGHNPVNISRNSFKSLSGHLNITPKLDAKYENPSYSGSQVIVLTRFIWPSRKGA